ncbi:MAG: recombination protein RecR [bacterium]|nr:recombination protein RecR [bacterium]
MAELRPPAVRELLVLLERLPGIGPRSAQSLVEHLLTVASGEVAQLAKVLSEIRERVHLCSTCWLLTEEDPCPICVDSDRDQGVILVVEEPTAAWTVEATREFRGLYHVLLGHLSPLHGVGPGDLTIESLITRVESGAVKEVILATNPTVEGETTALYIARRLETLGVEVSRPAAGIPIGGELGSVDQVTLAQALLSRRKI